jgi:hypothetical protein
MKRHVSKHHGLRFAFVLAFLLPGAPAFGQGIHVDLLPAVSQIAQGDTLTLEMTVAAPSDSFNAFDATLTFDDSLLTFIPLSTSEREGPLMTSACANRFRIFNQQGGDISLTLSLLCAGVKVAGPGVIFRFRFQAAVPGPVQTVVHIASMRFADEGIYVNPVTYSDATVSIGSTTGLPDGARRHRPELRAFPNPFRTATEITFTPATDGAARVEIFSVSGRSVRVLFEGPMLANEPRQYRWDGRDGNGARVPAGIYFVRATGPATGLSGRLVLIP